jgi:hypothetical protein
MQRIPDELAGRSPAPPGIDRRFPGEVAGESGVTAYDDEQVRELLHDWSADDLQRLVLVPQGSTLQRGAAYLDLVHPERGEFTALGGEIVEPEQRIVARQTTEYELWSRLLEWAAHQ